MKKNGFTLVELLAVIVILSALVLITIVSVRPIINNSKTELSNIQQEKIEEAAEAYYIKEGINSNDTCVSTDELIKKGYIERSALGLVPTESNLGYVKIETNLEDVTTYTYQTNSCE